MQGLRVRKSAVYLCVNEHFEDERNAADEAFGAEIGLKKNY